MGTSHSDKVKEDVSQEYFTCRNKLIYLSYYERSDELGGMAEIDLRMRTKANGWSQCNDTTRDSVVLRRKGDSVLGVIP